MPTTASGRCIWDYPLPPLRCFYPRFWAWLLHGPLPILGTALLVVMALAFLVPFKLAKPRLPGMILMILMGCAELVVVFLGVKP